MEIIEAPFDYLINNVFEELLKYEGRRAIDIETLKKAYDCVIKTVAIDYETDKYYYVGNINEWPDEIKLVTENFDEKLKMFLEKYSAYYSLKNNALCLNDEVNYMSIAYLIKAPMDYDFPVNFKKGTNVYMNEELRDLLHVYRLRNFLEKYKIMEDEFEQKFLKLDLTDDNSIKDVAKSLVMRNMYYHKVFNKLRDERLDALRIISFNCCKKTLKNYEVEPLSRELWEKCAPNFDDKNPDIPVLSFDTMIYDSFQYALYSSREPLAWVYISNFFAYNFPTVLVRSDRDFYIVYLYNLMAYEEQYGIDEDLEITRKKLLYLFDRSEVNLFIPQNLMNVYNSIKEENIFDIDTIGYLLNEIKFMADEIFMTEPNIHLKKKLIFLRTYFDLTLDKKLCDIIDSHRNHPKYKEYSEVIYGLNRGKARTLEKDE